LNFDSEIEFLKSVDARAAEMKDKVSRFDYVLDGFPVGKETVIQVEGSSIDPKILAEVTKAQVEYNSLRPSTAVTSVVTKAQVEYHTTDTTEVSAILPLQALDGEYPVCACDTCLEEAGLEIEESDNTPCDTDADGLQMAIEMIFELQQKFEALEARIVAHNLRASHKI